MEDRGSRRSDADFTSSALALDRPSSYAVGMRSWLRRRRSVTRLRLAQSLGAFTRPDEHDISPLYVFFDVRNAGENGAEISRLYVTPKGDARPAYEGAFEGDLSLPCTLGAGESARFWVRAKTLAGALEDAGFGGRPRVEFVVEDASGDAHSTGFRFRVDEYLSLKDE